MNQTAFGPFHLDIAAARVHRDGSDLNLRPQAFHTLKVLFQRRGEYVGYEQLLREAWKGTVVSRHTVASTVADARKALKEYGTWITYRPKLGYCMDVPRTDDLVRTGWHFWNHHTREGFEKALECFQNAAREHDSDPRALEGIASSWLMLGFYGMRAPREVHPEFLNAWNRAVASLGVTPELRRNRGLAAEIFERNPAQAEAELLEANRENASPAGCLFLALFYTAHRQFDTAARFLDRARAADVLFPALHTVETLFWFCQGEFEAAVASGKQGVELHPMQPLGRAYYALALESAGEADEALRQYGLAVTLSPDIPSLRAMEARCLARDGHRAEAERILDDLKRVRLSEYVDACHVAMLHEALGNRDAAFRELERAEEENSATLFMAEVDPRLGSLRADPRFTRLAGRLFAGWRVIRRGAA